MPSSTIRHSSTAQRATRSPSRTSNCAITEGRVACWGNNDGGQLGTLFTQDNATPALGLTDVVDVAASVVTMFAVRANGQLALGTYIWEPDLGHFRPNSIHLIDLRGGQISAMTAFLDRAVFGAFGLPETLPADA